MSCLNVVRFTEEKEKRALKRVRCKEYFPGNMTIGGGVFESVGCATWFL